MAEYNFKKRLELLTYAYDNSPFYKRLYTEHGIHPNDVKTEADWEKLPIITKEMYRAAGEEIVVDAMRPSLMMCNTGGSTGEPLKVYGDRANESLAIIDRAQGWWAGRKPGDLFMPEQGLLGQDRILLTRDNNVPYEANKIRRWPQTLFYFDVWEMSNENLTKYVKIIQSLKDDTYHMRAYTGGLHCFAQYCYDNNITLPRPISLHCGASILSENTRWLVKKVFNQTLMDAYGSNECPSPVATEHLRNTSSHDLYVCDDLYHLEFVNEEGHVIHDEAEGTTIITSFINHVAPLIRYNQGDRSHHILSCDPLNLPFSRISPILGRESVYLIAKDGRSVYLPYGFFDDYPECIKAFQLRQKEPGKVRLVVVENPKHPGYKEEINFVYTELKRSYADRFDLILETTKEIQSIGGKLNSIILE